MTVSAEQLLRPRARLLGIDSTKSLEWPNCWAPRAFRRSKSGRRTIAEGPYWMLKTSIFRNRGLEVRQRLSNALLDIPSLIRALVISKSAQVALTKGLWR